MTIVQDAAFPGLSTALDPERMRALLTDSALGDGLAIEAVRVSQVHYRPSKRCTVLYDVKFRPADGGRSYTRLVKGELTAAGASPADVPADRCNTSIARGRRRGVQARKRRNRGPRDACRARRRRVHDRPTGQREETCRHASAW